MRGATRTAASNRTCSMASADRLTPTRAAALALGALACSGFASAASANVRVCQEQEQAYEQIKRSAGPIEINNALSAAADKGCLELARRLLDDGASLQARDRLGRMALARAARAGHADIVDAVPGARRARQRAQPRGLDGALPRGRGGQPRDRARRSLQHGADLTLPGRSGLTPLRGGGLHGQRAAGAPAPGARRRPQGRRRDRQGPDLLRGRARLHRTSFACCSSTAST